MPSQPSLPRNIGYSHVLEQALQLENNRSSFKRLRKDIRTISDKHLLCSAKYEQQKSASEVIGESLKEKYPDFFSGEDNKRYLDYALMYVQQYHNRRYQRRIASATTNKDVNSSTPSDQGSIQVKLEKVLAPGKENDSAEARNLSDAPQSTQKTPLVERMAQNLALYSTQSSPKTDGSVRNTQLPTPKTQPRARPLVVMPQNTPLESVVPTQSPASVSISTLSRFVFNRQSSFSQPASSSSKSQVLSPPPCGQPALPNSSQLSPPMAAPSLQCLAVHRFLNSCVPSMAHLLDHFIAFGCSSEEFLLGISMWPRAEIEHFLDQLPVTANGMPLSPMEKLVLLNRFLNYFS